MGCSLKALVSNQFLSCSKLKFHIYTEHHELAHLSPMSEAPGAIRSQWLAGEKLLWPQLHDGENSVRQFSTGTLWVVSPELQYDLIVSENGRDR